MGTDSRQSVISGKKSKDLKIGIIGCMAERLKEKLLETEQLVDIVVGPGCLPRASTAGS